MWNEPKSTQFGWQRTVQAGITKVKFYSLLSLTGNLIMQGQSNCDLI